MDHVNYWVKTSFPAPGRSVKTIMSIQRADTTKQDVSCLFLDFFPTAFNVAGV